MLFDKRRLFRALQASLQFIARMSKTLMAWMVRVGKAASSAYTRLTAGCGPPLRGAVQLGQADATRELSVLGHAGGAPTRGGLRAASFI